MKSLSIVTLIVTCVSLCGAQQNQKKIALTPNSTASSGEVLAELSKKQCAGVALTGNGSNADYMLEVGNKKTGFSLCSGSANCPKSEYSATLFSLNGDVLFQTKSHVYSVVTLPSAMRDVCKAIGQQK
jgi:hypothetical protein